MRARYKYERSKSVMAADVSGQGTSLSRDMGGARLLAVLGARGAAAINSASRWRGNALKADQPNLPSWSSLSM